MIFLGYNFLQDRYCWQPVPTNLTNIERVRLENGIYDHFNITKDVDFPYITTYPGEWDLNTQMDADFNGNINAGNIDYVVTQISAIKIKRRRKGTFDWHTLYNVPINNPKEIDFVRYDYLAQNDTEYEYAIVPIIGNVEGEYSINSIKSNFYGIFITDGENSYKFKENASYSNNERVHLTATYEPYGSKYPVIISNGQLSYDKGTVGGSIIVLDKNEELDRKETSERLQAIKNFLTTPSAKILKDFNGNIWLVTLSDNLPITYYSEVGMGFARVDFNWSEIGDPHSGQDLYDNNLIYANN
ncbi:MAG: hypothetical protein ACLTPN_01195 [Clostridia bacterium]|jgi:hypothetical protein